MFIRFGPSRGMRGPVKLSLPGARSDCSPRRRGVARQYRESASGLQLAPATGAVVGDDLPEHGGEGRRVDDLALADGHGAGSLVVVAAGDDPLGVGDDGAVV